MIKTNPEGWGDISLYRKVLKIIIYLLVLELQNKNKFYDENPNQRGQVTYRIISENNNVPFLFDFTQI